ncbi:MAG: peptidylprolyl isomerase [Bdellovibrionales bacterium]|nr:peptidylprolyl isomerase [Bdellovibrionales bacterium]
MQRMIFSLLVCLAYSSVTYAQNVATVGKVSISAKEFEQKYKEVQQKSVVNVPSKQVFLEDLVRYEMGLQEAKAQNMEKDPQVQERYDQLLYQALIEKQIGKRVSQIKVSEDDMRNYYKSNPELRTSHILIEIPPKASSDQRAQAKKRAMEIYEEVKKSKKSFEELVAIYTDDATTKRSGGDIGWQSRLTITPEYYEAAYKLKVGQVYGLVETLFGFHILKLTGRNPYEKANKRHLRQVVFDVKRKQIFDSYFAGLKKKYPVKMSLENIK